MKITEQTEGVKVAIDDTDMLVTVTVKRGVEINVAHFHDMAGDLGYGIAFVEIA